MKSLIISNFSPEETLYAQKYLGVISILNPRDIPDLKEKIRGYANQFDRVFVTAHGGRGSNLVDKISTITLTQDERDRFVKTSEVIRIINENSNQKKTRKEIHLLSCHAGAHFGEEEALKLLQQVTKIGQKIFLHSDENSSNSSLDYLRISRLAKTELGGSITNSILASPEALNVFVRSESGYSTFSHSLFTRQSPKVEISLENLRKYLVTSISKAKKFERENGFASDPTIDEKLANLTTDEGLKEYLSKLFLLEVGKISGHNQELQLLSRWKSAIDEKLVDLNNITNCNETALYAAAQLGHLKVVETLIKAGANLDIPTTDNGATALQIAADLGHLEVVKALIEAGANLDIPTTDNGATALQVAAKFNNFRVVEALIKAGADLNIPNTNDGATALYIAAEHNHLKVVEALIKAGADLNIPRTDYGTTALYAAAERGHLEVVEALIEAEANPNITRTDTGGTALYVAAEFNHFRVVEALIEAGADLNIANTKDGATALYIAAEHGHLEVVEALIEAGADLNIPRTDGGTTALYAAAERGHLKVVKALIEAGEDLNIPRTDIGTTALYAAAYRGQLGVVKALIEAGADLNIARTKDGAIALHAAAEFNHFRVVETLIEAGADLNIATTKDGATALYIAAEHNHLKVVEALIKAGANLDIARTDDGATALYIAAERGYLEVVEALIKAGANLNIADKKDGWTPLMHLVFTNDLEAIKLAIDYGADIYAENKYGHTALFIAQSQGKRNAATAIRRGKARMNKEDREGNIYRRELREIPEDNNPSSSPSPQNQIYPTQSPEIFEPHQYLTQNPLTQNHPMLRGGDIRGESPNTTLETSTITAVATSLSFVARFLVKKFTNPSENPKQKDR